nr:LuxR C-terminal-related transcriptional regulator [Asticcacaulis solisilvae]
MSRRQKEILRLVARHHQVKEIARLLNISEATVRTHTEEARRRLGAATSREAAIVLLRHESGDGSLSEQELLPGSPADVPGGSLIDSQENVPVELYNVAAQTEPTLRPAGSLMPKSRTFAAWLKERSIIECVGIILLMALGLTVILVALLTSAATLIQAIQNLTGQTQ